MFEAAGAPGHCHPESGRFDATAGFAHLVEADAIRIGGLTSPGGTAGIRQGHRAAIIRT